VSRSLNKVTLIGNLGADPEVRSTQNGGRVATLSVATSRQWKGQDGQMQEKTEWHRVIFWNSNYSKLADIAEKYCRKGEKIYVTPKTIITPAARDMGEPAEVFAKV